MELQRLFEALADRTRLRLINLMSAGEICVCYLVDALNQPQPTISRHLAYLREAGLVSARRSGKWMTYRLEPPENATARRIFADVVDALAGDRAMQTDRAKLAKSCCAPKFRLAPKPSASPARPANRQ